MTDAITDTRTRDWWRAVTADALAAHDYPNTEDDVERPLRLAQADAVLDALLPEIAAWIQPHRWDKDYPDSAPPGPCHGSAPDTFYAGVLHAAAVIRDCLPPTTPTQNNPSREGS